MSNIKNIAKWFSRVISIWWSIYSRNIDNIYNKNIKDWFKQDSINISKDFTNSLNKYVKR
jgi:hypothetical protein